MLGGDFSGDETESRLALSALFICRHDHLLDKMSEWKHRSNFPATQAYYNIAVAITHKDNTRTVSILVRFMLALYETQH